LRFAARRPGIPEASPRSHGVPRRDVHCRVHVSVAGVSAGGAPEDGLALARLPVHHPARRAALARERRFDPFNPSRCLLVEATYQQTPPRTQDASVEPSFLTDIAAWVLWRSFRGSGHVLDLQIFDPDRVEAPCNIRRGFFGPVLAPIGLTSAQSGDGKPHPRATVRSAPCPGQSPFQPPHAHALSRSQARSMQQFTCREGCGDRYATVNAYRFAVTRCGNWVGGGREVNVPAPGMIQGHAVGLSASWHCAGPAESHPPGLRHPYQADVAGQVAYFAWTDRDDPKSFVPPSFPPRRSPGWVSRVKECGHRSSEIPQGLLLDHLRALLQPWVLCAGGCKLPTLLQISRSTSATRTPVQVLLDGQVPHEPGMRAVAPQHRLLNGRREHPVPRHANTIAIPTDISGEVRRRLPSPGGRSPMPRSS
jgi:hypothetical protein